MTTLAADNKQDILKALSLNEAKIKSFGVRSLSLFGSSARGEDTPESDLDFVVEFEKKSFDVYTRDAFDQDDRTVDTVIRNLQIIGEAAKMVPESVRANHPTVAWKKIADCAISLPTNTSKLTWTLSGTFYKTSFLSQRCFGSIS